MDNFFPRHVDFFSGGSLSPDAADHNDIVTSWEELYRFADGRHYIFREPACIEDYITQQLLKVQ
jgi:hypothetical protein